jgi:HAD superfamily hydrolase (TIGR01549 family)
VSHYEAVLFDWVGTLVHYQTGRWRLRRAHEAIGRQVDPNAFASIVSRLDAACGDPDVSEAMATEDCSPVLHRNANMLWFDQAGLDTYLAEALYAIDSDPATHPVYPDARDVLATLHSGGVRVGVVSDFHLDLRPTLATHGLADFVDVAVISSEEGFQKPDTRMFTAALGRLEVEAEDALMVGDRDSHDGAAASIGVDTLILPTPDGPGPRGLHAVLRLVG